MNDPIHLVKDVELCDCKTGCRFCDNQGHWFPGWYFWDETWSYRYGPFCNRKAAELALVKYAKQL